MAQNIYILQSQAYMANNELYNDIIYIDSENLNSKLTNKLKCIRIKNIQLKFLCARPPGLTLDKFEDMVDKIIKEVNFKSNNSSYQIIQKYDSQLFTFEKLIDYVEFTSNNPYKIKDIYERLKTELIRYYHTLDESKLTGYDKSFYDQTETPFRNVQFVTDVNYIPYYLSCYCNVPCVGLMKLNKKYLKRINQSGTDRITINEVYELEFNKIQETFEINSEHDLELYNSIKIIAYDIETYMKNMKDKLEPLDSDQPIICIGFGIFKLGDIRPIGRFCIISKDFNETDIKQYKYTKESKTVGGISTIMYKIRDYEEAEDETTYFIVKNEKAILNLFITYINSVKPYFISGFNNWTFDDKWVEIKSGSSHIKLNDKLLTALSVYKQFDLPEAPYIKDQIKYYQIKKSGESYNKTSKFVSTGGNNNNTNETDINESETNTELNYDTTEKKQTKKRDDLRSKFVALSVKLDNEVIKGGPKKEGYNTWRNCFCILHDTMFAALKEDPKRFSNRTRKNLDTMLEVYNINNPYNGKQLSKTGLKIIDMFKNWEHNTKIYEIAKYCCQDSWITGTFAIKRNMYGDLIEMSIMTNTTTQDSVYKAVNIRVANTIAKYAHDEGFALFDVPERDTRNRRVKPLMGNKYFDKRTLIGGMVKNKRNGREKFIVALDFSSMYPSQKEGSNVDTSSRVTNDIILNPQNYNLQIIDKYFLEDMYGARWFYKFQNKTTKKIYNVEEFFTEFKVDKKMVEIIRNDYKEALRNEQIDPTNPFPKAIKELCLERFKNEINPYHKEIMNKNKTKRSLNSILEELLLSEEKLPHVVKYPLYFCQSPKDEITDLPLIHYSIKEKLLSDFRAKRNLVKADMKKTKDPTVKIQLSAKEKAIKVVMNSEYGQTGSDLFAHYDSDIGGAVTYGSRSCIMELTSCLHSKHFYVDESYTTNKFLQELINPRGSRNKSIAIIDKITYKPNWILALEGSNRKIKDLITILQLHTICPKKFTNINTKTELDKVLSSLSEKELTTYVENNSEYDSIQNSKNISQEVIFNEIDFNLPPRRITVRDLYFKLREEYLNKNSLNQEIYCITLPESQLIYQDTDSNYYTNNEIVLNYPVLNPTTINEIMTDLISHNNLLSNLIPDIIHRRPIGVGFEGAFVVARYLNKKKKYYGKKWSSSMRDYVEMERNLTYSFNKYEVEYIKKNYNIDVLKLQANLELDTNLNKTDPSYDGSVKMKFINDSEVNSKDTSKGASEDTSKGVSEDTSKDINKSETKFLIRYDWRNLPEDYENYLDSVSNDVGGSYNSYYSSIPYKDGSYFSTKQEIIGDKDFIDYINLCGIKCTGVDLARRDQYKFINFNHVLIIKEDMKYVDLKSVNFNTNELEIENKIDTEKFPLTPIIMDLFDKFIHDSIVNFEYPINYYSKFKVYKDNLSEVKPIVESLKKYIQNEVKSRFEMKGIDLDEEQLKRECEQDNIWKLVPEFGQRISYIILDRFNDDVINTLNLTGNGVKDKGFLTTAALWIFGGITIDQSEYTPEIYKNEEVLSKLDYQDYFSHLVTSLVTYLIVEDTPSIANYLDDDFIQSSDKNEKELEEEMNKEIQKIKNRLVKSIVTKYYPTTKIAITSSNKNLKKQSELNRNKVLNIKLLQDMYDLEEELINDKKSRLFKYIPNETFMRSDNLYKDLTYFKVDRNKTFVQNLYDTLRNNKENIKKVEKCSNLIGSYNILLPELGQKSTDLGNSKLYIKIAFDRKTRKEYKFFIRYGVSTGKDCKNIVWKGAPNTKFEKDKNLIGEVNWIPRRCIYDINDLERFIHRHINSFKMNDKEEKKSISIEHHDYDNFMNLLDMLFMR